VTDARGVITRSFFNAAGYETSRIIAVGRTGGQTITYVRDPTSNLVRGQIDALGRNTVYQYDARGNVLSVTRLSGTPNATTTSYTYTGDFNRIATMTDALQHSTTYSYDTLGNLTSVLDANNNSTTYTAM
jgi:YD repeat-containing protein